MCGVKKNRQTEKQTDKAGGLHLAPYAHTLGVWGHERRKKVRESNLSASNLHSGLLSLPVKAAHKAVFPRNTAIRTYPVPPKHTKNRTTNKRRDDHAFPNNDYSTATGAR